jgi:hypothetical protein
MRDGSVLLYKDETIFRVDLFQFSFPGAKITGGGLIVSLTGALKQASSRSI